RADAGLDEADLLHAPRIDDADAAAALVGHVEVAPVGGELHVDWQAADADVAGELHLPRVDLYHDAAELGARDQVAAVRREVEMIDAVPRHVHAADQLPGPRAAE